MFHKLGYVNKQVDKLQSSRTLKLWLMETVGGQSLHQKRKANGFIL